MHSVDAAIMKFASFKHSYSPSGINSQVRGNAKNTMDAFNDYSIYSMCISVINCPPQCEEQQ